MSKIRHFFAFTLLLALFANLLSASAASSEEVLKTEVIYDNSVVMYVTTTASVSPVNARSSTYSRTYTKKAVAYDNDSGVYLGTFYLQGEFEYDGSSAKATNDSGEADPASGYKARNLKHSHSGARVTGSCTFTGEYTGKVSLKITCDKNGNIS